MSERTIKITCSEEFTRRLIREATKKHEQRVSNMRRKAARQGREVAELEQFEKDYNAAEAAVFLLKDEIGHGL